MWLFLHFTSSLSSGAAFAVTATARTTRRVFCEFELMCYKFISDKHEGNVRLDIPYFGVLIGRQPMFLPLQPSLLISAPKPKLFLLFIPNFSLRL